MNANSRDTNKYCLYDCHAQILSVDDRHADKVVNISNRILRPTLIARSELGSWLVFGRDGGRIFICAMVVQHRSGCAFL